MSQTSMGAMQKALNEIPTAEHSTYVRARIKDGSLPGHFVPISAKEMLGACSLVGERTLSRVYYEVLLQDQGADVVAEQVSSGREAREFVRIFGGQSVDKLPNEFRNAFKREKIEQDFGL